jgi:vancomycin resistance protein VanJ
MRVRVGRVVAAGGSVYVLFLLGVALSRGTQLGQLWWVRMAGDFLPFLFLPLMLLAPLVLILSGSRPARLLLCVPLILFVFLYGRLFLPKPATALSDGDQTFSVMSYNVTRGDPGVDNILSIIESENADVVALQEVSPEVADALSSLAPVYGYMAVHPTPDGYAGCALLSRFPIISDEAFPLVEGMHLYQRVVLDLQGQRVHLLNVHFQPPRLPLLRSGSRALLPAGYDTTIQDRELERLLGELETLEGTAVVVGDLNMTDQSPGYGELTARLGDAYGETGWGFGHTFPDGEARSIATPFPLLRIDYIFHSRDIRANWSYVGDRGGPDHRFLVAGLSLG